jgi:5-methylcytosine-specific restriction endonuclease McrA
MTDWPIEWYHLKRDRRRTRRLLSRGSLGEWTGKTCPYCRRIMTNLEGPHDDRAPSRDHRVPRSRGGLNEVANIDVVCQRCNHEKGDLMPDEFGRLAVKGRTA